MNRFSKRILAAAITGTMSLAEAASALALPVTTLPDSGAAIVEARGGPRGRGGGGRPHGGAVARPGHGGAVGRPGGYHGGWHGGHHGGYHRPGYGGWHGGGHGRPVYGGGWRRPYYRWAPGGAIAAGAAIGVLSAAAAAAYASTPAPASGLCWYYTDATYRAGFWDVCR
jgi:hypothetical protein